MSVLRLNRFSTITAVFVLAVSFAVSCVHEPLVPKDPDSGNPNQPDPDPEPEGDPCEPGVIYFQNDILPILVSNCAKSGCHNATSHEDGIVLDSYENLMDSDVIEAGDAGESELYEKITDSDPDDVMPPPPHQKLTAEQISIIRIWIEDGATNTSCSSTACDTTNVTYSGAVKTLVANKCTGCHSGNTPSGGLNFTTHAGLQAPALDGRLFGAITHASGFTPMPQGGRKLSSCEINTIKLWIDAGAPNN